MGGQKKGQAIQSMILMADLQTGKIIPHGKFSQILPDPTYKQQKKIAMHENMTGKRCHWAMYRAQTTLLSKYVMRHQGHHAKGLIADWPLSKHLRLY